MNRKINKKGFTLTEILAVIAILGVILAIAVPSYNSLSKKFEKEYYEKLDGSVLAAAKSYYKENAESRPAELLYSNVVTFSELIDNKNIDDIKGYKSESNLKGRIIIVKKAEDYDYKMCYLDSDNNSDNNKEYEKNGESPVADEDLLKKLGTTNDTNTNNCDANWLKNTKETFEARYGSADEIYLYYSETNNPKTIKEKLGITKTLKKKSSKGEDLDSVPLNDKTYYPTNITGVDLTVAEDSDKIIFVTYPIQGDNVTENITKEVNIVRYDAPIVKVGDEEINGKTLPYNTEINLSVSDDDTRRHKNLNGDNAALETTFEEKIYCGGTWRDWSTVSNGKKIYTKNSVDCEDSSIKISLAG